MSDVLGQSAAVNQDIVEKDEDKLAQPRSQRAMHRPLKSAWCPGQSKSHNTELEVPQVGSGMLSCVRLQATAKSSGIWLSDQAL